MSLFDLFNDFGDESIQRVKDLFHANNKNASGKFRDSLDWKLQFDVNKLLFELDFESAAHAQYIQYGRRTQAKLPPTEPIQRWMKIRGIPLKYTFPIKRKITDEGIKPFDFVQLAFNDQIIKQFGDNITGVLQKEITEKLVTNKEINK